MCKVYYFAENFSFCASVMLLAVIALERYIAVLHPLKAKGLFTKYRMHAMQVSPHIFDMFCHAWLGDLLFPFLNSAIPFSPIWHPTTLIGHICCSYIIHIVFHQWYIILVICFLYKISRQCIPVSICCWGRNCSVCTVYYAWVFCIILHWLWYDCW